MFVAVFADEKPGTRASLVATTSPAHRTRAIGRGSSVAQLRNRFPRARALTRSAIQAFHGSRRVFAIRSGRVAAIAVVDASLLRAKRRLADALRQVLRA
jgi:hypothetical protein